MKVWVVYGYNEIHKMWDELDYSQKFRNVRYFMNPNSCRAKTAREHGFTKFVYVRKSKQAMWCFRVIPYMVPPEKYFTSARVAVFLKKLAKYERASLHTDK
jgi:hypothetical protein